MIMKAHKHVNITKNITKKQNDQHHFEVRGRNDQKTAGNDSSTVFMFLVAKQIKVPKLPPSM